MIKSYLKIGIRHFRKNRLYSIINLAGLTLALTWCVLVFSYLRDELQYDRFHPHINQIAMISMENTQWEVWTPPQYALGAALVRDYPEIVSAVRFSTEDSFIKVGHAISEAKILGAENSFFEMLNFPLKWGEPGALSSDRHSIYLTEQTAWRHFGRENPVGRMVELQLGGQYQKFEVVGVFKKLPAATSFNFTYLIFNEHLMGDAPGWEKNTATLIQVAPESDLASVLGRLDEITQPYLKALSQEERLAYRALPFTDYHLKADGFFFDPNVLRMPGSLKPSLILGGLALLILALASANYVNLAMACLMRRFREMGMRKILGAVRGQIVRQLIMESLIIIGLAFGIALGFTKLLQPAFEQVTGRSVTLLPLYHPQFLLFGLASVAVIILLTVLYPAVVLARMGSIQVLQNRYRLSGRGLFSKGLIALQFAITVFLICVTVVVMKQQRYMMQAQFGHDADHIVCLDLGYSVMDDQLTRERVQAFKEKVLGVTGVEEAACSVNGLADAATFRQNLDGVHKIVYLNQVEPQFFSVLGLSFVDGGLPTTDENQRAIVVTDGYARFFVKENPLGKILERGMYGHSKTSLVCGILKDFNVQSLKNELSPHVMEINPQAQFSHMYIRMMPGQRGPALAAIQKLYADFWPDTLIKYDFLSELMAELYQEEARWSRIMRISAVVALLIAFSGLLALTLLTIGHRTREISIRRVLGASSEKVLGLVQSQFMLLVFIGTVVGCPIVYWTMRKWLDTFAFRTELSWWVFVSGAAAVFVVAFVTIAVQTLLSLRQNPADSLRVE